MYIDKTLYNTHPEKTETEKEGEAYLLLEKSNTDYVRASHDAAATIDLCEEVEKVIGTKICKNLLLCNRQCTEFYMLLLPGSLNFKTKYLSSQIGSSRLSFASGEQMEQLLNVSPGSLTVLSLMYDKEKKVKLLIEKSLFSQEYFACHPCVNTATVRFKTDDLFKKVLPALEREYKTVDLINVPAE